MCIRDRSTPTAALVYTLAIGKDGRASDAYSDENQFISDRMAEAESVSARKATLLNPTEDDETVQVLRRRLFASIDDSKAAAVIDAYRAQWLANKDALPSYASYPETIEQFKGCFPSVSYTHLDVYKRQLQNPAQSAKVRGGDPVLDLPSQAPNSYRNGLKPSRDWRIICHSKGSERLIL